MAGLDQLQRFLFEDSNVRGALVQLEDSFQHATREHGYPAAITRLLGESLAASTLMSNTLKFEGLLTLQAQGDGPVRILVAECTHNLGIRGLARFDELPEQTDLPTLIGNGRLVITLAPRQGQRYQGIVPLEQQTLAGCLQDYFALSEQLETFILLFADDQRAGGLMLQKLPGEASGPDHDLWPRLLKLAETTTADELLYLEPAALLRRLFHQEQVRLFDPKPVEFSCSCNRDRSRNALEALGQEDCYALLEEQAEIEIDCQFCGRKYIYRRADIESLFGGPSVH